MVWEEQSDREEAITVRPEERRAWTIGLMLIGGICVLSAMQQQELSDSSFIVQSIQITGNETTKDFIILREMSLAVGSPVTAEALEHDKNRIYNLGLFNKVEIDTVVTGRSVELNVRVHERWYLFPFPIVGFKYRNPKNLFYGVGLTHQNFRGRNEKVFFMFALGFDRWVQLGFQTPKLTDDDDIYFQSSLRYAKVQSLGEQQQLYSQTQFSYQLSAGKRFGLYQWVMAWTNYDVWEVSVPARGRTVSGSGRDASITVGLRYTYDTRNIHEYTTSGWFGSLQVSKYGLGESEVNFYKLKYDVRSFSPITGDLTFAARAFGTFSGGGVIPNYRREYFGYDERIRGYFRNVYEGEQTMGGSVEFRFPILHPRYVYFPYSWLPEFSLLRYGLYGGFFADAGRIWERRQGFSFDGWKSGFGGGLHFLLPYSIVVRTEYALNDRGMGQFVLDFGVSF
jgi:outer membrane protein insertion porin family